MKLQLLLIVQLLACVKAQDEPFIETSAFIGVVVAAAVVVSCALCCCTCMISNGKWAKKNKIELDAMVTMVETKKGKIEYIKWGEAPYMLILPGTPGWAYFHYGFTGPHTAPFGAITVNRPGYGNVPLTEDNKTAEQQADLLVALMDHLGIEKFPLLAASGGGCIGLRMAIQYPEKIQCLLMQCGTTGDYVHPDYATWNSWGTKFGMTSPFVGRMATWYVHQDLVSAMTEEIMAPNKMKPGTITQEEAAKQAKAFVEDPYNKVMVENFQTFMKPGSAYPDLWYDGILNDLEYWKVKIPFDQVKVPTHMIHGDCDEEIHYSQAVQAHAGIVDSILITQVNDGHGLNYNPKYKENFAQQIAFAKKHCGMEYDEEILNKKL